VQFHSSYDNPILLLLVVAVADYNSQEDRHIAAADAAGQMPAVRTAAVDDRSRKAVAVVAVDSHKVAADAAADSTRLDQEAPGEEADGLKKAVVQWNGTTVEGVPELAGEGVPEVPKVERQVAAAEEEALRLRQRQQLR